MLHTIIIKDHTRAKDKHIYLLHFMEALSTYFSFWDTGDGVRFGSSPEWTSFEADFEVLETHRFIQQYICFKITIYIYISV